MPVIPCPVLDAPIDATDVAIEPAHRHTAKTRHPDARNRLQNTIFDT
jgi:hypothetical protein